MNSRIYKLLLILYSIGVISCKDQWKEHNQTVLQNLNVNLYEQLQQQPELSTFAGLVKKIGFEEELKSTKSYTLWAPTNAALNNIDQGILADPERLKKFVLNHIAFQNFFVEDYSLDTIRLLSGKNAFIQGKSINNKAISQANNFVKNGVLHRIEIANAPVENIYEFLLAQQEDVWLKEFIQGQDYVGIDTANAEIIAIDETTGLPIFAAGSGEVMRNSYFEEVAALNNEDKKYTFILLKDSGVAAEKQKLSPYFYSLNPLRTDTLTSWSIAKDLVFEGVFSAADLVDSLRSIGDVDLQLSPSKILSTHHLSNGIVYVLNELDYQLPYNKIKPIRIEGEHYTGIRREDRFPIIRTRKDPAGIIYKDVFIENHGTSQFWLRYMPEVNSVTYKVLWRAPRDYNLTGTIVYSEMAVGFNLAYRTDILDPLDPINPPLLLPYKQVDLSNYNEVYLGEYTPEIFGQLNTAIFSKAVTTNAQNTIVLDYIKLIPVFN